MTRAGVMYGVTVWRPWGRLIVAGVKPVENRNWGTEYRGLLAIHSGHKVDETALLEHAHDIQRSLVVVDTPGAIIGVVELVDIVSDHPSRFAEPGSRHWVLSNPRRLVEPVRHRGTPGLWPVPPDIAAHLLAQAIPV